MELPELIKTFNKSFEDIKNDYSSDFEKLMIEDGDWLNSIEDKTNLLNSEVKKHVDNVIAKLKDTSYSFIEIDIESLTKFTSSINNIVRIGNRINNFKQGSKTDNGNLDLPLLFNTIKSNGKFSELNLILNSNLKGFIPHLFSIIKHCQDPQNYPIYYKFWKNVTREVLQIADDYDSLCDFFRTFPKTNRNQNFGCYLGTIGINLAKGIGENRYIESENDSVYNYVKNSLISLPKYFNLIEGYKRMLNYYLIGSKYGTEGNQDVFPIMLSKSVVSTGFAWNIDLTRLYGEDQEAIKEYLAEQQEPPKSIKALSTFLSLKIGDKIAVKADGSPKGDKGFLSIVGIAEVIEKNGNIYEYDSKDLGHLINVKYLKAPVYKEFEIGGYGRTIQQVTKPSHIQAIFDYDYDINIPTSPVTTESTIQKQNIPMPKNIILYGPPGTGKTYNSIDKAVEIVTGKNYINHSTNKELFDGYRKDGQIEFVTFHQNYSYEDFMIGIRPDIENIDLRFVSHRGIFYEIARRARQNYYDSKKDPTILSKENWVKDAFEDFKEHVQYKIEEEGKYVIKNAVSIYSVEEDAFRYTGEKEDGEKWKNERLGLHYEPLITSFLNNVTDRKDLRKIPGIPHSTYGIAVINKFREYLKDNKKEFKQEETTSQELKKFVLIIDEINRANISRVFGELITLIEDDKRLGEENQLQITLPNGEVNFGIPPNLYIIGTMNTADKSISLVDIALRRRFEFIGYYPNYDENIITDKEKRELLQSVNKEIYEKKKSADYLIGHAYFMKSDSINDVLLKKVIPLLMEYFSGRTDEVKSIFKNSKYSIDYDNVNYCWNTSAS